MATATVGAGHRGEQPQLNKSALGLWDDTAVIVCTDHGHYLGERDAFGKPPLPVHRELGHIPLLMAWPGVALTNDPTPRRVSRTPSRSSSA